MEISFDVTGEDAEITVSIYKAEKDYNTTCSQKPLREETFSHLTENLLWQFKTLPAGDYLIVFTDANNAALLKSIVPSDAANRKILNYRNGEVMTERYFEPTFNPDENMTEEDKNALQENIDKAAKSRV